MWRLFSQKWLSTVVAALGFYHGVCGSPVLADHFGHTQSYDVVQGYIIQCPPQPQSQVCVTGQTPTPYAVQPSGQNQGSTLNLTPSMPLPAAQTVTLQLAPAQAPIQTLQLAPAPAQVQTLQLAPAPAQVQTLQLAPALAQVQTLQLAPAPVQVQVQTLQLAPAPVQTLQLTARCVPTQTATPVTLLVPHHKCHWFCRH
jgi:hypothetical protein